MVVYALCTEMTGKTLTLWSIGEKNEVPETINERNYVTTYYSDINEARRAYRTCSEQLSGQNYTCVDNT
jgi:hypothetical protein